jgi:hypothetical protein
MVPSWVSGRRGRVLILEHISAGCVALSASAPLPKDVRFTDVLNSSAGCSSKGCKRKRPGMLHSDSQFHVCKGRYCAFVPFPNRRVDITLSTGTLLIACMASIEAHRYTSFATRLQLAGFSVVNLLCCTISSLDSALMHLRTHPNSTNSIILSFHSLCRY